MKLFFSFMKGAIILNWIACYSAPCLFSTNHINITHTTYVRFYDSYFSVSPRLLFYFYCFQCISLIIHSIWFLFFFWKSIFTISAHRYINEYPFYQFITFTTAWYLVTPKYYRSNKVEQNLNRRVRSTFQIPIRLIECNKFKFRSVYFQSFSQNCEYLKGIRGNK